MTRLDRRTTLTGLTAGVCTLTLAGCLDNSNNEAAENPDSNDGESTDQQSDSDSDENQSTTDDGSSSTIHEDYETTEVRVMSSDEEELGEVTAAIADTPELQSLGLSDTDDLPEDRGMLFVYDEVEERTFGMPDMSFGIDIVFADEDGTITRIFHAPEPEADESGLEQTYIGQGQYVLEVIYEWTGERGVEEGDLLQFDL